MTSPLGVLCVDVIGALCVDFNTYRAILTHPLLNIGSVL